IDQAGIFRRWARESLDLPMPAADEGLLRALRGSVGRAVAASMGVPRGPVHLNVPFAKPLEPVDGAARAPRGEAEGASRVAVRAEPARPTTEALDTWSGAYGWRRAVIVAGPSSDPGRIGPAVRAFAAR